MARHRCGEGTVVSAATAGPASPALGAGAARGVRLPSADIVRDALVMGVDQGLGDKDWSALADVAHRRAGITR